MNELNFDPQNLPKTVEGWTELEKAVKELPKTAYLDSCWMLSRVSLYWMMLHVLSSKNWKDKHTGEKVLHHPYALEFINEVQHDHDGVLTIASRGHIKSYTQTWALLIQKLLLNPEETICIFSFSRQLAKNFLRLIKSELENNELLKDISFNHLTGQKSFWSDPYRESPLWTINEGIVVNRQGNPRESSVEAWGLVDGLPVGRHYSGRVYDDITTRETTATPEQIQKTIDGYHMSLPLGMPGDWETFAGTFYVYGDALCHLIESDKRLRLRPCYELKDISYDKKGIPSEMSFDRDKPTFFTKKHLETLERGMTPHRWATQYLCHPVAGLMKAFDRDSMKYYKNDPWREGRGKNIYILVDPANSKKKTSDYTSIWVVGVGGDKNLYILDGVRDRLNLEERTKELFKLHRLWEPIETRYERYGMQSDIGHIESEMEHQGYRFWITEVAGKAAKEERIERLVPFFNNGRIYFPKELRRTRVDGSRYDLIEEFVEEEFTRWPASDYDDMLDCLARIDEPDRRLTFPTAHKDGDDRYSGEPRRKNNSPSWKIP